MQPVWWTVRWWWRLAARPLRDHLVPRGVLWLLVLVQVDAMVDAPAVSRQLMAQPPWVAAAAVATLVGLHALAERRGVRATVGHRRFGLLRRQPLGRWEAGAAAGSVLLVLAAPVAGLGWLWSRSLGTGLLWAELAVLPLALAGARRPVGGALAVLAAGVGAGLAQALWVAPAGWASSWVMAGALAPGVAWGAGDVALRWPGPPRAAPTSLGRPWGPLSALLHRDLVALARTEPALIGASWLAAPVVGAMVWAARVNGGFAGEALVTGTSVALAFLAPLGLSAVAAVARALGPMLDPPSWPVRPGPRLLALAAVASTTLVPSWAAAAVGGRPALGWAHHLHVGGTVTALAFTAAAVVAWRPHRPDHGLYPYVIALCLAATLVPQGPWFGAMGALTAATAAWVAGSWGLRRRRRQR